MTRTGKQTKAENRVRHCKPKAPAKKVAAPRKKQPKKRPAKKKKAPDQRLKITDEHIMTLPIQNWNGETRVLNTLPEMKAAVDEILALEDDCLGFDIESKPNFKPKGFNPPALLQIATEHTVFLFRLCHLHGDRESNSRIPHNNDTFSFLSPLLSNPSIVKAGVGIRGDIKDMQSLLQFDPSGVCALESMVKDTIQNHSLKALAAHFLKVQIPKSRKVTMSNWAVKEPLSQQQIQYAASDAWLGRAIWQAMRTDGYAMKTDNSRPKKRKHHAEQTTQKQPLVGEKAAKRKRIKRSN